MGELPLPVCLVIHARHVLKHVRRKSGNFIKGRCEGKTYGDGYDVELLL